MPRKPIGKLISYIYRQNQKYLSKMLKPYGIGGGGQHSFLIEIIKNPGISQDQLTAELKFDKATTARAVKQLEGAGYVNRTIDQSDRRSYQLYPTQKALDFYPALFKMLETSNQLLTSDMTEEEIDQLLFLLRKLNYKSFD
ncbi:MarR family winged helix-turn-helix transcriptional regulator [Neobacillus muris]|uniref:MarR family winged helix-turn-helix transcriptional regulator n=1 Tax=Neobacillus muris TaxID=2941334 RepID=UPI00204037AF|nr:MarR family winged helix-turn-helix transcriptional regulator [Neobacillus muris]